MLVSVVIPVTPIDIGRRITCGISAIMRRPAKVTLWVVHCGALDSISLWRRRLTVADNRRRMRKGLNAMWIESKVVKIW
jgi:hypothetical protein